MHSEYSSSRETRGLSWKQIPKTTEINNDAAKIQRTNLSQWIVRFLAQVQRGPGNPLVYLTSDAPWQSSWFSRRMSRVRRGRGIVTRRTSVKTILVKLVTFGESPLWPFPIDLTHSRAAAGHTLLPPTVEYYLYTLLYTYQYATTVLPWYTLICWMIVPSNTPMAFIDVLIYHSLYLKKH